MNNAKLARQKKRCLTHILRYFPNALLATAHSANYQRYTVLSEKAKPLLKSSSCPDALLRPTLNNQVYQKAQGPMLTQIFCFG